MYIIDTNYFVRAIVADDLQMTTEARNIFKKIANQQISAKVNTSVIFEIVYVLTKNYFYSRDQVYRELMPIISLNNLELSNKVTTIQTLQLFLECKLDIVDCYLITQAKNQNLELLTFDKKCKNKFKELLAI